MFSLADVLLLHQVIKTMTKVLHLKPKKNV